MMRCSHSGPVGRNEGPCLGKWGILDMNSASSHPESVTSLQLKIIWVPVWASVALPDNTELFLSKPSILSCAGGLWESSMIIEEEETRRERSRDGGFAERTWGELRVASVLQSPDDKDWHSPLQLRTSCHPNTQNLWAGSNPQGSWSKWHHSTWLPNQGMSEREQRRKMWWRRMLFIVIYVGLAESGCWWSFLINIFYSIKIKEDENRSLELFNKILEVF